MLVTSSTTTPWVEKYRPEVLNQVVHHSDIVMRRFVRQGQLPHLLFYGPPGTGKTSVALSLANEIYGGANKRISSVLELNASDERGIDVVRDQIKGFAGTKSLFMTSNESNKNAFKMIILDECDAMTSSAQNALRRVMERSVKNVRFVLICNYVGQIIPALQSRCTRFRFSPIPSQYLSDRLEEVVANESLEINPEAKESIVSLANGDMRRVLNVLQACASSSQAIDMDTVYAVTGAPHPRDLDRIFDVAMGATDYSGAIETVRRIQRTSGIAVVDIVRGMYERLSALEPIPDAMRIAVNRALSDIEYYLAGGASESHQLGALVGVFFTSRRHLSECT